MSVEEALKRAPIYCSFCGGEADARLVMYASVMPGVFICDQCVDFSATSLAEWRATHRSAGDIEVDSWMAYSVEEAR